MHRTTKLLFLLFAAALLVTGGIACHPGVDDDNLREDVILCEDAVNHAIACCPGLAPPQTACVYRYSHSTSDCACTGHGTSYEESKRTPVLDVGRSDDIANASCDELSANDGCAALAAELAVDNFTTKSTGCNGEVYSQ